MEIKIQNDSGVIEASIVGADCLDATNAGFLKAEVAEKVPPTRNLVLSMAAVQSVDSAGIGALVTILKQVRKGGGRLGLVGVNPQVRSLLEVIRLTTVFEIFPDEGAALAALAPSPSAR